MKITEKTFNVETGEETIIEREETLQEKSERVAHEKAFKEYKADLELKTAQRQAILDKLGLTADEARLLLG
jgi:hypothetical protein